MIEFLHHPPQSSKDLKLSFSFAAEVGEMAELDGVCQSTDPLHNVGQFEMSVWGNQVAVVIMANLGPDNRRNCSMAAKMATELLAMEFPNLVDTLSAAAWAEGAQVGAEREVAAYMIEQASHKR